MRNESLTSDVLFLRGIAIALAPPKNNVLIVRTMRIGYDTE